jgi:hypothetical protein
MKLFDTLFYIKIEGQSAIVSWCEAHNWWAKNRFFYCQTFSDLLLWGTLSEKKRSLSFTIVAGPRQRTTSRVGIPRDSGEILNNIHLHKP